jgi:hypothetical protein
MDVYAWIWIAIFLAFYGVPFGVGVCVPSWPRGIVFAIASFAGLYASIWSALGPLFLPMAVQLVPRFELWAMLVISFAGGALQAALLATAGFACRRLFGWILRRSAHASVSAGA